MQLYQYNIRCARIPCLPTLHFGHIFYPLPQQPGRLLGVADDAIVTYFRQAFLLKSQRGHTSARALNTTLPRRLGDVHTYNSKREQNLLIGRQKQATQNLWCAGSSPSAPAAGPAAASPAAASPAAAAAAAAAPTKTIELL